MTTSISPTGTTAPVTTQGIGTGLDIAGIVDKLMALEQAPVTRLQNQEAGYQTTLSAYASVKSALATFQTSVANLAVPTAFSSLTASINDSSAASVAIDNTQSQALSAGTHTLNVTALAASQRTASSAFTDPSSTVGTGTITIDVGTWNAGYTGFTPNGSVGSRSITIDSSNNTLVGVRDAINAASAGVNASIVNDGTGNRLVLSGTATGAANGFRISTADADGNNLDASGLSALAFDPSATGGTPQSTHLADAVNARFSLDGLTISKPNNHVTDAIAGLTLDLKAVSTSSTAFTIARDTSGASSAINNFVSAYNTIVTGLASLTSYNATTNVAGTLNGDSTTRLISTRLQSLLATVVPTGGSVTSLADVGVKFQSDGTLAVDATKLTSALTSDPNSVARLFAKTGVPSDSLVNFTDSTDATQQGNYALSVSHAATSGALVGSSAAGLTITTGVNDTLSLTIDNVPSTITLAAGTYADANALAAAVQSRINGTPAFSSVGSSVAVSQTNGVLTITSQRFGSASSVAVTGGNAQTGLLGTSPTATTGSDVAGTIDGTAFIGTGQTATGAAGTPADGLKLTIAGGSTGSRGTVSFTRGIAASMNDLLTQFLDPTSGLLQAATDGLNSSIADLKQREDDWTPRLAAIRARYTAQYNAMDALVASMNSTSTYLTQQITAIQNTTNFINSGK